jgi:hypothetical protein
VSKVIGREEQRQTGHSYRVQSHFCESKHLIV